MSTSLTFTAVDDMGEFGAWRGLFAKLWPAYRTWYLQQGPLARPTYAECRAALARHMPKLVPLWERLVDEAGGGDLEARFLSLYCPPAYLTGCSQAIWPGSEPLLVRNYDYSTHAFEAVMLRTNWSGRNVIGTSDCLIGLVDGMNEAGLVVSLTFGGRREVGIGFGVPIILRYVLETCTTTRECVRLLERIPSHMTYNVTVLDRHRRYRTVYLAPDRPAEVTRMPLATNHQGRVEWIAHARETLSVERERFLQRRLSLHEESAEAFVAAFMQPPLYSTAHDRGFGTLYTAAFRPRTGDLTYHWPGVSWPQSLTHFGPGTRSITYPHVTQESLASGL
jgi:predicted choloylglycine hydrolase